MKKFILPLYICLLFSLSVLSQSAAIYDISITTIWNTTNHTSVPGGAHWSPLAGATHKNSNDILQFGALAPMTNGIKDIAETGSNGNFQSEVNTIIKAGNANQYLQQGFSPFAGNNSNATLSNVSVDEGFPYITLVSMVAPSPDWFISLNSENLKSGDIGINNGWKDTYTIDVFAYDAGTDDGTDYTSPDAVSNPRINISKITGFPINGNKMGTITFTFRGSTLGAASVNSIENIKIYPNPTQGNISISNIQNNGLKTLELYNVLGVLVKHFLVKSNSSKLDINLTNTNKGIYILKLNTIDGISKNHKLIIK
jgi:hypothetical protein